MSVCLENVQAVLFDMDGVIVDSTALIRRIYIDWAVRHGFNTDAIASNLHGGRTIDMLNSLGLDQDAVTAHDVELRDAEVNAARLVEALPGAKELLTALPRDRWAIVTSSARPVAEARIAEAGLPYPKVLVTADDVSNGKPSPEAYELAARRLRAQPQRCVVIEDSINGARSAHAAVMSCIGVGAALAAAQPRMVCGSVSTLTELQTGQGFNGLRLAVKADSSTLRPTTSHQSAHSDL